MKAHWGRMFFLLCGSWAHYHHFQCLWVKCDCIFKYSDCICCHYPIISIERIHEDTPCTVHLSVQAGISVAMFRSTPHLCVCAFSLNVALLFSTGGERSCGVHELICIRKGKWSVHKKLPLYLWPLTLLLTAGLRSVFSVSQYNICHTSTKTLQNWTVTTQCASCIQSNY